LKLTIIDQLLFIGKNTFNHSVKMAETRILSTD